MQTAADVAVDSNGGAATCNGTGVHAQTDVDIALPTAERLQDQKLAPGPPTAKSSAAMPALPPRNAVSGHTARAVNATSSSTKSPSGSSRISNEPSMNGRPANTATSSSSQPAAVRAMPSLPVRVAGSGTAGVAGWAQALNCIVQSSLFIVKFKLYSDVGSSKAFHWASLKPFASQPACCLKLLHTGNCCTPTNQPTTCNGWRLWHCWSWAMARCRRHLKLFLPAVWSGWGGGATGVIDPEESPATQKLRLKVHDIRLKLIRAARRLGYEHDSGLVKQVPRRIHTFSAFERSCQTQGPPTCCWHSRQRKPWSSKIRHNL